MTITGEDPSVGTLSRRRFGAVSLGGTGLFLLNGRAIAKAAGNRLPPGVAPVTRAAPAEDGLARSTPEAQGVSSATILAFLDDVQKAGLELHSFMLMRNKHVVAEGWWWPYRADRIHMTHSLTKSAVAAGVGLAIDEGRFGHDDKIVSFFPEFVPANASENVKAMTVHNLLTMQTGQDHETSGSVWRPIETSWVAEFFKIPVPNKPGTNFLYTSAASYMLSAIVTKTTGQSLENYMKPRFFEPLGIKRYHWDSSPGGISPGGNGLSWTTADSLKLGALHAQGGEWNGHRVLSEKWVKAATTQQVHDEKEGGYGYQWWMGPGSAYYALGLFTQLAIVFPEQNATLAIFSAIDGSKLLKPLIWKHFPAAFSTIPQPASAAAPLLKVKTQQLRLLPPLKLTTSPTAARISGRRFNVQTNDQAVNWISFEFKNGTCTYRMQDDHGEHSIVCGLTEYLEQDTSMTGHRLHHEYRPAKMRVVAGARWIDKNQLELTWQFVEAAFRDTVICRFDGDGLTVDRSVNLNSAETKLPTLTGTTA